MEALSWSNGLNDFTAHLSWDPLLSQLSITTSDETQLALFQIAGADGLLVSVPEGYPVGTGDEFNLAIRRVVPEPKTFGLLAVNALLYLLNRKRSQFTF